MTTQCGINYVRWHTSPACLRLLERLACHGPATPVELAGAVHICEKYAYSLLRKTLHGAGVVHVYGWQHHHKGRTTPIWAIGPGKDKPEPAAETHAQRAQRRRRGLNAQFGTAITTRLLEPKKYGYPQVHIDGQRVRSADHGTHLAKRGGA